MTGDVDRSQERTYPVSDEAAKDARPAVERVPDERPEGNLGLRVPDGRQDRHPGRHDGLDQPQEEAARRAG